MIGIIYSKNTGRVRSHTDSGNTSEYLDRVIKLLPGEDLLKLEDDQYGDIFAIQDILTKQTGITPTNDRYAIVDKTGTVTGAVIADPLIDSVIDHQLIVSADASPGWVLANGILVDPNPLVIKPI